MKILLLAIFALLPDISHAGFQVDQQLQLTASTVSTKILEGKAARNYLLIVNNGANPVYIKLANPQTSNEGLIIPSGGNWEPALPPSDALFVKTAFGTTALTIITGK